MGRPGASLLSSYERGRSSAERCIRPPPTMTAEGVGLTLWLLAMLAAPHPSLIRKRIPPLV